MLTPEHRTLPPYPVTSTCLSGRTHEGVKGERNIYQDDGEVGWAVINSSLLVCKVEKTSSQAQKIQTCCFCFLLSEATWFSLESPDRAGTGRRVTHIQESCTDNIHLNCNVDILIYVFDKTQSINQHTQCFTNILLFSPQFIQKTTRITL